jgi:hypothetical protein
MAEELNPVEKQVWCHVFLGRCKTSGSAGEAEAIAEDAVEVLRRRGLVKDAASAITDRVLYPSGDSIPVCVYER